MEPVPGPQSLSSVGALAQRWLLGPEGGQAFAECGLAFPRVCPREGPWVISVSYLPCAHPFPPVGRIFVLFQVARCLP